jgi:hypothetical protein
VHESHDGNLVPLHRPDGRNLQSAALRRAGVDTATAMQIVGHKSDKMWKRDNAIEESDLLNAAKKR